MHAHTQEKHEHINAFKATKDIAAGQEILIQYDSRQWFDYKDVPYADVDYASTMWEPHLQPLPCRQSFAQTTVDGRQSFAVREAVASGAVLEVSLCVEMPVTVVDQFPFLWDFVLTGEIEDEYRYMLFNNRLLSPPPRTRCLCFCAADRGQRSIGEVADKVLCVLSPRTLNQC